MASREPWVLCTTLTQELSQAPWAVSSSWLVNLFKSSLTWQTPPQGSDNKTVQTRVIRRTCWGVAGHPTDLQIPGKREEGEERTEKTPPRCYHQNNREESGETSELAGSTGSYSWTRLCSLPMDFIFTTQFLTKKLIDFISLVQFTHPSTSHLQRHQILLFLLLYFMCMSTLSLSSNTPEEGTRSHYKRLWAIMWLLGIELGTSGRAVSALNCWAISPAPALNISNGKTSKYMSTRLKSVFCMPYKNVHPFLRGELRFPSNELPGWLSVLKSYAYEQH
jgi:hypothetical protein